MNSKEQHPQSREELFTRLYLEAFPAAAALVGKHGGSFDQASDVFQEALICYYEQVIIGNKITEISDKAYLLGITRNLWYQQKRTGKEHESLEIVTQLSKPQEAVPSSHRVLSFLETAGKKCMDMLQAFYYDQLPLEKIANRFGFRSTRSATVQKYKCLEKMRQEVKKKELTYADFTD